jgi:DNA-binding CsgD family transcriptional regulator
MSPSFSSWQGRPIPALSHPGLVPADRPEQMFNDAEHAHGGFVMVTGLAGIGKSTWVRQLCRAATRHRVVAVNADFYERQYPFAVADKIGYASGVQLSALGALTEPLAVARELLAALGKTSRHPLCLVIDNAHWIDDASVLVLRYLLSRLVHMGTLVVFAGLDPRVSEVAERVLGTDAGEWPFFRRIELAPLDELGIRRYVSGVHGREISLRVAGLVRERSGGIPVLIDAAVAALVPRAGTEVRSTHWDDGIGFSGEASNPFHGLAASVSDAVRNCLEIVCVLRDGVSVLELTGTAGALGDEIDLAGAVQDGLVVAEPGADDAEVRPFHDLFAVDVAGALGDGRRRAILAAAADVLGNDHRAFSCSLAAAMDLDPVLEGRLRRMVKDAVAARRTDVALGYLRSAVALATGRRRDDLIVETCLLAAATLSSPSVIDLIPDLERMPADPVRDLALLQTRQITGDISWAHDYAAELSTHQNEHPDAILIDAHVAMMTVMIQLTTDDYTPLLDQLDRVREHAVEVARIDRVVDRRLLPLNTPEALILRATGLAIVAAARLRDGERIVRESAALSAAIDGAADSPALVDALTCRAGLYLGAGHAAPAAADLERALRVAETVGAGWSLGHTRALLAQCYWILGRYDEAKTVVDLATLLAFESADVSARPLAYLARALLAGTTGDEALHRRSMAAAGEVTVTDYDTAGAELELLAAAEAARAQQRWDEVLEIISDARVAGRWLPTRSVFAYRVDALAALGRAEEADRQLEALRAMAGAGWEPIYAPMAWLEGRVEEAYGHVERAHRSYVRAIAEAAYPLPRAIAEFDAGRMRRLTGDRSRADRRLRAAAAQFRRLGATPYLRRVLAMLDGRDDGSAASDGLESLTAREREVALYAARGLTNAEVASALFLSVPTVSFHMRHVLAKLGLSSRRELKTVLLSTSA